MSVPQNKDWKVGGTPCVGKESSDALSASLLFIITGNDEDYVQSELVRLPARAQKGQPYLHDALKARQTIASRTILATHAF